MKKLSLILFVLLFSTNLFAQTPKEGTIDGETWTKTGSPYIITGDLFIADLSIQPGVTVLVNGNFEIEVAGLITAIGTEQDSIVFTKPDSITSWQGIFFNFTTFASKLQYCKIEHATNSGIRIVNSTPTIQRSTIINNSGLLGGGISIFNDTAVGSEFNLANCAFINNKSSSHGGALRVFLEGGHVIIDSSSFENNTTNPSFANGDYVGGAFYLQNGDATILNSSFIGNLSISRCTSSGGCNVTARGGAIYTGGSGNVKIENSIFRLNETRANNSGSCFFGGSTNSYGAAVYVNLGTVTLTNSILVNNSTTWTNCRPSDGGGGLYVNGGSVSVINCVIAENSDATGVHLAGGALNVINSIIYFNNGGGSQTSDNFTVTYSDVQNDSSGEGNIDGNPIFTGDDFRISSISPCVDSGNPDPSFNDVCFPPSLGKTRNDMGAYGGPGACNWLSQTPFSVKPTQINFGEVLVDSTLQRSVTISNSTFSSINVNSIKISGTNLSIFSIDTNPFSLPAMSDKILDVRFTPSDTGVFNATISFESDSDTATVELTGIGKLPDTTAPQAPQNLNAIVGDGQVTLLWNANDENDFHNYFIYGDTLQNPTTRLDSTTVGTINDTTITITALTNKQIYYFKITAIDTSGNESNFSNEVNATPMGIPMLEVGSDSLIFGEIIIGDSLNQTVSFSNTGTAVLNIDSIFVEGNNASDFFLLDTTKFSIDPGNNQEVRIQFKPSAQSSKIANLVIQHNAISTPDTISLIGNGKDKPVPIFQANRPAIDFGTVTIKTIVDDIFKIFNPGTAILEITKVTISGLNAGEFAFISDTSFTIESQDSAEVLLRFSPDSIGAKTATLTIAHNAAGSPDSIALNGIGGIGILETNPNSLPFGDVTVGDTADLNLQLNNVGLAELSITAISFQGSHAEQFIFTGQDNFSLAADATNDLTIRFTPTSAGTKNANLIIQHDGEGDSTIISLSGIGGIGMLETNPNPLAFGNVTVGDTADLNLQLNNVGSSELNITALSFQGNHADQFIFTGQDTFSLAANATHDLTVRFAPASAGTKDANLIIQHDGEGDSTTVSLSGDAVPQPVPFFQMSSTFLEFDSVLVGSSVDDTLKISNPGSALLDSIEVNIIGLHADEFTIDPDTKFSVEPKTSVDIVVRFSPTLSGEKLASLIFTHTASSSPDTANLFATGVAPTFDNVQAVAITEFGNPVTVTTTISNNSAIQQVQLLYRKGGESDSSSVMMMLIDSDYQADIPSSDVGERGVEFRICATDNANNQIFTNWQSVQVRLPDKHLSNFQSGDTVQTAYRLISFPLDSDDPSIASTLIDDLGPPDTTQWRLWDINPQNASAPFPYQEFPSVNDLVPGKSLFLITAEDATLTSPTGITVKTIEPFKIPLQVGWNMVASPFNFEIPIQNIAPTNLQAHLSAFNGAFEDSLDSLKPWEGYLIKVVESDTLIIWPSEEPINISKIVANGLTKLRKNQIESSTVTPDWLIRIKATCQNAYDNNNIAGIIYDAANEWDHHDRFEPPPIGEYIAVSFPQHDWQRYPDIYTTDFRPPSTEGYVWDIKVATNISNQTITLEFESLQSVPPDFEIKLINTDLNVVQDLRQNPRYVYRSGNSGSKKKFRLLVGKPDSINDELPDVPGNYELAGNFPNPFNPTTTIKFGLPQQGRVSLKIYNVLGREVATLLQNAQKDAGNHVMTWNGKDQAGGTVPSGIYIYQLRAGGEVLTRKMSLIK